MIGDPGETDSNLLRRADPNEVIAAAAVSSSVFPRKYIFVNFRAWEFAGSDRIWAGIVTNLASAIEAEFGIVTSRLFRTTNVSKHNRRYINLNNLRYTNYKEWPNFIFIINVLICK